MSVFQKRKILIKDPTLVRKIRFLSNSDTLKCSILHYCHTESKIFLNPYFNFGTERIAIFVKKRILITVFKCLTIVPSNM